MFSHDLHAYVRALMGPDALRTGPFTIMIDAHDGGLFRNYAVPDDSARPGPGDVAALVAAFRDRDRVPRLEYLPDACPDVEPVLLAAGFVTERRLPALTCPPDEMGPPAPVDGVDIRLATTRDELRVAAEVQNEAYGMPTTGDHDVDRLAGTVAGGGLVVLAVDTGTGDGVGSGLVAPPHHGVGELAAIGVRTTHRRRGLAAAMTAFLTRACGPAGIPRPFLTPAGEAEERIYRRVGYDDAATMIHISRPI